MEQLPNETKWRAKSRLNILISSEGRDPIKYDAFNNNLSSRHGINDIDYCVFAVSPFLVQKVLH